MRGKAKICLFGYVGNDPKKPSDKNPDFVTFPLAVTTRWKDDAGTEQEHTDWYEVITSQKGLSGVVSSYVKKGDPLYIEGTPKYGTYTSKDGEVKTSVTVNLREIELLGSKDDANSTTSVTQQSKSRAGSGSMKDSLDDPIPF